MKKTVNLELMKGIFHLFQVSVVDKNYRCGVKTLYIYLNLDIYKNPYPIMEIYYEYSVRSCSIVILKLKKTESQTNQFGLWIVHIYPRTQYLRIHFSG